MVLVRTAPDVAEALANPHSAMLEAVESVGLVCNPADMTLYAVDWRNPAAPLAARAAAFAVARAQQVEP